LESSRLVLYGLPHGPYFINLDEAAVDETTLVDRILNLIVEKGISTSLQVHMLVPQHKALKPLPIIVQETKGELKSEDMLESQRLILKCWKHHTGGTATLRQASADGASFARKTTQRVHTGNCFVAPSLFFPSKNAANAEVQEKNSSADDRDDDDYLDFVGGDCDLDSPYASFISTMTRNGERGQHAAVLGFATTAACSASSASELRRRFRQLAKRICDGGNAGGMQNPDEASNAMQQAMQHLNFSYGMLSAHPAVSMHVPWWEDYGYVLITQDPMHCRWRLRRQYLRTRVRSGVAILATGASLMNPTKFAEVARKCGGRMNEKDYKYSEKQNEKGCMRLAGLTLDGAEAPELDYLASMWAKHDDLPGNVDADVLFWTFFRKFTAMFTDRTLATRVRLQYSGFIVEYLSLSYELVIETERRSLAANWFTSQTAYDTLTCVMLYSLRTLFEESGAGPSVVTLRSIWRREGSIHSELAFQLLRLLVAPGNTFDSMQAFRVLLRRLVMRRDVGSGNAGNARHGASQEAVVPLESCRVSGRQSPQSMAAELDTGMKEARSMLNKLRPWGMVDRLQKKSALEIGVLAKVAPKGIKTLVLADISIRTPLRCGGDRDGESHDGGDNSDEDEDDADGCDANADQNKSDDEGEDGAGEEGNSGQLRRNPPRRARSAPPANAAAAAHAAREPEITQEARNMLRLQGAVDHLRSQLNNDTATSAAPVTGNARRSKLLVVAQQALAKVNANIRKQHAGREFRFNAQGLLCGTEAAVNGPLSFSVGDTAAVVCVTRHGGRAIHYADIGEVEELTLASSRGVPNHDRARVVSRHTRGAQARLKFFRRVELETAVSSGPARVLLGHSYATHTSPPHTELFTKTDAPQVENRWEVGSLLCRVGIVDVGLYPQCALSAASQRSVDAILKDLNSGMFTLDEAITKHVT
jgi:hypothetical protein